MGQGSKTRQEKEEWEIKRKDKSTGLPVGFNLLLQLADGAGRTGERHTAGKIIRLKGLRAGSRRRETVCVLSSREVRHNRPDPKNHFNSSSFYPLNFF